jgi:hypothetical protein
MATAARLDSPDAQLCREVRLGNAQSSYAKRKQKAGAVIPHRLCSYELSSSVQLFANFRNALGQQIVGDRAFHRLREDGGRRGNRGIGRRRTDVGQRL